MELRDTVGMLSTVALLALGVVIVMKKLDGSGHDQQLVVALPVAQAL